MRRKPFGWPILVMAAIVLAGCNSSAGQNTSGGGTLTVAFTGPCCQNIDVENVLAAYATNQWFQLIYEHLVTYGVNSSTNTPGAIVPDLAKSWSFSPDHLTWTFKLQPNVKWQDGTAFTSDDVAFSLALCLNPKSGGCLHAGLINDIAGADAVKAGSANELSGVQTPDPLTVQITTTQPDAAMLDTMSNVWIVQKRSLSLIPVAAISTSTYWTTPGQAVGTGPFKLASYQHGQSISVVRFDQYWRGQPKLAKIIRVQYSDPSAALLAFDKGQLDLTYLTADEVGREKSNANAKVIAGPGMSSNLVLTAPTYNPALGNKLFLQGLSYAIDRQAIITNLYGGGGEPLSCPYGPPALRGTEMQYTYDPTKAKQLIQQSGVDVNSLPTWEFDTYYSDPLSLNVMTAIQHYWAAVGFKVTPLERDGAAFDNSYRNGHSPISFQGSQNGPDGNFFAAEFTSGAAFPKGDNGYKQWFYNNPQVDQLFKQGVAEFDPAKRNQIYQQICTIIGQDQPWITLWQTTRYFIVSKKVANVVILPAPLGYYDAAETWST